MTEEKYFTFNFLGNNIVLIQLQFLSVHSDYLRSRLKFIKGILLLNACGMSLNWGKINLQIMETDTSTYTTNHHMVRDNNSS